MLTIVIITVTIGVQLLAIGCLIKYKIKPKMTPEHKTENKMGKEGMAEVVGNNLILMGTLAFFSAGLQVIVPAIQDVIFLIYVIIIIPVFGLKIFLSIKKYEKKTS